MDNDPTDENSFTRIPETLESAANAIGSMGVKADSVCILASGISMVAGEIVSSYADESSAVPIPVICYRDIPAWVDRDMTIIALSCSEGCGDIRKVYEKIKDIGCSIIAIAKDGQIADLCRNDGHKVYRIPVGMNEADSIGYMVGAVAAVLQELGVCEMKDDIIETVDVLRKGREDIRERSDDVKGCISSLVGRMTGVYSPSDTKAAAIWWSRVLNERLNTTAFVGLLPEFNHNEIVGWSEKAQGQCPAMLVLSDKHIQGLMGSVIDAMGQVLKEYGTDVCRVHMEGGDSLQRNLMTIMQAEYVASMTQTPSKRSCRTPAYSETEIPKKMKVNDPNDTGGQIYNMVDDLMEALETNVYLMPGYKRILLCGMGGSGISNDIIKDCCSFVSDKFIYVLKFPTVPEWVDRDTLVIISSYSGNTHEVLEIYDEVVRRGCSRIVITSGGEMESKAKQNRDRIMKIKRGVQPRHAIGYMVGYIASIMDAIGEPQVRENLRNSAVSLGRFRDSLENRDGDNQAMELAKRMVNKVPVAFSDCRAFSVVLRWKAQISENSKMVAFADDMTRYDRILSVAEENPDVMPLVMRLSENDDVSHYNNRDDIAVIDAGGDTRTERTIRLVMLGDYVSLYLAYLRSIDPTEVAPIKRLKHIINTSSNSA